MRPEYTLLAAWGDGHQLRYVSHRAPVTDNFGNDTNTANFEAAERYFSAESEDEALAVVAPLGVRYVVVRRSGSGHDKRYEPRAHFQPLYLLGGSETTVRFGEDLYRISALTRHRQVFVSQRKDRRDHPMYRVFEIVEGARAVGKAEPGSTVTASLLLNGVGDEPFQYRTSGVVDASGRFELRLPYPTNRPSGRLRPISNYTLRSGPARASLGVSERAVHFGETITAARLRASDSLERSRPPASHSER